MQKTIYILIVFAILLGCSSDNSTQPQVIFQEEIDTVKIFGGTKNESAQSVTSTNDGGYAVLGYTQSMDGDITDKQNESFDYWLLKFNSENTLQWSKTYGGSSDDKGSDIIQTSDGGFAILGYSSSNDQDLSQNAGSNDYWLAKLDALGNISWQKSFGFSGADSGTSLIQTTDNGYLLIGVLDVTASGGQGNNRSAFRQHAGGDYWAIKLNQNGNVEWRRYFGGTFTDTPNDVIETNDNAFIIVGSSDSDDVDISNNKGSYDFWIVKISNTGDLIWEKSFGGSEIDEAYGIAKTDDGNYMVVGNVRSNNIDVSQSSGAADLWVVKISPTGDLISEKTIGGSSFDVGRSIKKTQDNGFIISGSSRSSDGNLIANQGQNDAWVLKIDNNTNIKWQKTIGGTDIDFAYDAVELNDNTVVLVGESNSSDGDIPENNGFTDVLIVKIK